MPVVETLGDAAAVPSDIRFDDGRHHRAKLGFVILAMEQTVEEDIFRLIPEGVGIHFTRAAMANRVSVETLAAMAPAIGDAAALLLPDAAPDVVCYACTSGSIVIGEERVFAQIRRGAPGAKPTCLITSVMRSLRAVGAHKIAVATPYSPDINALEKSYMEERGFEIVNIEGLNIENDADMTRVRPDFLLEFARSVDRHDADAIFISCSALRSVDIIEQLEAQTGKPVIVSNQAMAWDCLRLAGIADRRPGYGRLFRG